MVQVALVVARTRYHITGVPPPGWQRPSRKSEQGGRDGRAMRAPTGWQPFPFMLQQQVGGSRLAGPRLYARSAS